MIKSGKILLGPGRILLSATATLFLTLPAASQTAPPESGITVLGSRWYRQTIVTTLAPNITLPIMGDEPLTGRGFPTSAGKPVDGRRYVISEPTIQNDSASDIQAIHWDHVFVDPTSGSEMARFHFFDERMRLAKGRSATFAGTAHLPPSSVVEKLGKGGPGYSERIDIRCVSYKGSVYWQAAGATDAECAKLRKRLRPKPSK